MNIKNNKRRLESQIKIEKTFIEFLKEKDITQISVSDICTVANLNRSTFYSNYTDIYELADKIREKLEQEVLKLFENDLKNNCIIDYLQLFHHIKENQAFYNTYFKLGYDAKHTINIFTLDLEHTIFPKESIDYHIEFHRAGLNAVIKKWLNNGCKESPEAIAEIIRSEYINRTL